LKKFTFNTSLAAIIAFLFLSAFSCNGGRNGEDKDSHRVILPAGEVHEGWYFAGGDRVYIEGTVNGDVYAAGGMVDISGTINGDLIIAGGQVNIGGTVSDDIRAAGGSVELSGKVGKDVTVAGGTVTMHRGADVTGNLLGAGGSIHLAGTIGKNVRIAAAEMSQTGSIGGNLDFAGEKLAILPGATIAGNLTSYGVSKSKLELAEGAVLGTTQITEPEQPRPGAKARPTRYILGFHPAWLLFKFFWITSLLVTGLVLVLISPKNFLAVGSTIIGRPGASALWGLIAFVVTPVAVVLLFITVIGLPIGLFVLALYFWLLYLSQLALGIALGSRIFGKEGAKGWNAFWPFAVGLIIIQLLSFIPFLGALICIAGIIFGLGAILLVFNPKRQQAPPAAAPAAS
jgi:cytoskeletal protein CcmA (bactofilin family)